LKDRKFEPTGARLERGKYLSESVMGCFDCHSERDWNSPGAPMLQARMGVGRVWAVDGLPLLVSNNITPDRETGAGNWTDDMLARAIREGIGHDGRTLFPLMPYQNYRQMSDEDLASVIAYLRSIPPVRNPLPKTDIPFPLSRLIQRAPQPLSEAVPAPDVSDPIKRGRYLTRMAGCADCHTPQDKGEPIAGLDFAGGFVLLSPQGAVASTNITPSPSGIPYYDEALFLSMMRTGRVGARVISPVMPWVFYKNMTDEDLKAIFAYLRTVKPVNHQVDNAEPPTYCKLCLQSHGLGDRN
jgi:mono/diheme cytochrome c family protein